jgi:hypothetical protein
VEVLTGNPANEIIEYARWSAYPNLSDEAAS